MSLDDRTTKVVELIEKSGMSVLLPFVSIFGLAKVTTDAAVALSRS